MSTSERNHQDRDSHPITVEICLGTTCYVVGSSDLQFLEDHLPLHLRDRVQVKGATCLEVCKDRKYGKAPYARVNGDLIAEATVAGVVTRVEELCRRSG